MQHARESINWQDPPKSDDDNDESEMDEEKLIDADLSKRVRELRGQVRDQATRTAAVRERTIEQGLKRVRE